MSKQYFSILLEKYINGTLSPYEWQELSLFLHAGKDEADLKALIDEKFRDTASMQVPPDGVGELIFQRISEAKEHPGNIHTVDQSAKQPVPFRRRRFWTAAAAVIIVLSGVGIVYVVRSPKHRTDLAIDQNKNKSNDVAPPAVTKAVITLASGLQIMLDSAGNGIVAQEGDANVTKLADGQIVYSSEKKANDKDNPVYNMVSVPRGSRVVAMTLGDGTKVWLNAASSMRYPVAFTGSERKVEVSGEVYFEVAKDRSKKFVVEAHSISTEVFGTHFNIRSHEDEASSDITLLEGSVKVSRGNNIQTLKPGDQAQFSAGGGVEVNRPDLEQVMAWKDGRFQFEGAEIKEVMREIARWYDLETIYEGAHVSQHFRGGISRNVDASRVFKRREATDAVHFRIENKKIIVTP